MERIKKISSIILRIGISAALLFFLFRQVGAQNLWSTIKGADLRFILLAFLVSFFSYLLCLFRWEMLLKAYQIHLPLKRVILAFSGGLFFNLFMPSSIGGDVVRSIDLAVQTKKTKEVLATVLLDRLSGYVGLVILAAAAMGLGWKYVEAKNILFAMALISGILILILLVLFNSFLYSKINKLLRLPIFGKIGEAINNLHEQVYYFKKHTKIMLINVVISLLVQAVAPVSSYITALALGLKIPIIYFFVFLPIIGAITMLPISLGGLGLRDWATIFFFAKIGVSKDLAFAMSLVNFSYALIYGSIGGFIYVATVHYRRLQSHQPSGIPQAGS